jgi:hypothetical protein
MFIIEPITNKRYVVTDLKGKKLLKNYIRYYQSGGDLIQPGEDIDEVNAEYSKKYKSPECVPSGWPGEKYRSPNDCMIVTDKAKLSFIEYETNRLKNKICGEKSHSIFEDNRICKCIDDDNNACNDLINRPDTEGHHIIAKYRLNKDGYKDRLTEHATSQNPIKYPIRNGYVIDEGGK